MLWGVTALLSLEELLPSSISETHCALWDKPIDCLRLSANFEMQFNIIILDTVNVKRSRVGSYAGSRWQGSRAAHLPTRSYRGTRNGRHREFGTRQYTDDRGKYGAANCACATASTYLSESTAANQGQIFLFYLSGSFSRDQCRAGWRLRLQRPYSSATRAAEGGVPLSPVTSTNQLRPMPPAEYHRNRKEG